ncbi:pseudouridylate synthase TRUB1 isoform X2 [Tamandua tetradactyla]|uniref:pseudouridylate synthase TRUB1 isoform X2 n=1 Tax=Tamandua tetradactyla TaxID=48850 RepID=UPI004053D015
MNSTYPILLSSQKSLICFFFFFFNTLRWSHSSLFFPCKHPIIAAPFIEFLFICLFCLFVCFWGSDGPEIEPSSPALQRYIAIGELGKATDTLDSTGKVTEEKPYDKITQEDIESILQKFTGNIMQVPPLYSALKKDGQRLSTLMKRGEVVEAKPARPVTVYSLSLQKFQPPFFTLDVECGGGFYIRSLVSDIGKELSSCANVLELTRTKQGPFTLEEHALPEDKWTINDIAQSLEYCSSLLPAEFALKKSKPEESKEQVLSCEYISLNETKGEDDVIKIF